MGLEGDITSFSIPAVGRMIHREKKTGVLRITNGSHVTRIYFRCGDIVFFKSDLPADMTLGALLRDRGLVDEKQLETSLDLARRTQRRLGAVLVEKGHITRERLTGMLHHQFREAMAAVLSWESGTFSYQEGLDDDVKDVQLTMDPMRLMAEGQKWKAYRRWIPNERVVFQLEHGVDRSQAVSGEGTLQVMLLIDGKRDVSQIIRQTGLPRAVVYRCLQDLADQAVISRSDGDDGADAAEANRKELPLFLLRLLQELLMDIQLEIGEKRAAVMLRSVLNAAAKREYFLQKPAPEDDGQAVFGALEAHLKGLPATVSATDIMRGVKRILLYLMREADRVLGSRATGAMLARLAAALDTASPALEPHAAELKMFLQRAGGEQQLYRQTGSLLDRHFSSTPVEAPNAKRPIGDLSQVDGGRIITFYGFLVQLLLQDLEADIGQRAQQMLQERIRRSEHYDHFLCQFRTDADMQTNVDRIRTHIARKGYRLSKKNFISGFQLLLIGLLNQKRDLLGKKALENSMTRIRRYVADNGQAGFDALGKHLIAVLDTLF